MSQLVPLDPSKTSTSLRRPENLVELPRRRLAAVAVAEDEISAVLDRAYSRRQLGCQIDPALSDGSLPMPPDGQEVVALSGGREGGA